MKLKFPHLGNRLLSALGASAAVAREAHSDRLRDVLGRDRALAVGARTPARGAVSSPRALALVGPASEPVATQAEVAAAPEPSAPLAPVVVTPVDAPEPQTTAEPRGCAAPEPVAADLTAAAAAAEERPQRVKHEPIRTRTMARLLAAQGYRQRALAIYDELLAHPDADAALRAEAEALRQRST